jgi:hypothetical protein
MFGVLFAGTSMAQSLSAGDIAIVQMNADGTDDLAFVALTDIPGDEVIKFTDNGWKADNTIRTGEGTITWTAPVEGVSCGTVVTITTAPSTSLGSVTEFGSLDFSVSGDQVLAYQGEEATPSFLAALNNEGGIWQADATSSNTSALPAGLVDGLSAVAISEVDNAKYQIASISDTKANVLASINNAANWAGDDVANQLYTGSISVTECAPVCEIPTGLSVSGLTGTSATMSWDAVVGDVAGYKFQFQNEGTGINRRRTLDAGTTSISVSGPTMIPGDSYVFAVKTLCSDGSQSAWSDPFYFSTPLRMSGIVSEGLNIYPNPSNGSFALRGWSESSDAVQISIMDMSGKLVYARSLTMQTDADPLQLDLQARPGMYIVHLVGTESTQTFPIVIE